MSSQEVTVEVFSEEEDVAVFAVNMDDGLWTRMKAHCLDTNPYLKVDASGREVVVCPRCMTERLSMEYTTFNMEPPAVPWSCSVQKCPECHHIFAFVR